MKINVKKYLLYSSVTSIFTEAFFFNYIIDWKLFYLIIITNYVLLIKIKEIKFNKYFALLLLFFLVHGILTYTIIGIPYNFMISQILGIAVVGTYFYNLVSVLDRKEIIDFYLNCSFWVAAIAYPMYFFNINLNDGRLQSIFKEPAHYVIVVIPACYYFLKNKKYLSFAIVFGTLILSMSSLGYIGCALMFLIPNLSIKRIGYMLMVFPIIAGLFYYIYTEYPFFKLRVDDTYNSLKAVNIGKFEEYTNQSSYVLLSNMYIAKENFLDHPLGSGIGSHHYMHTKVYIKNMRVPPYIRTLKLEESNSFDANSLFTRIFSEFGVFGLVFMLYIFTNAWSVFKYNYMYFEQGVLVYFLLKLFRDGTYFPPELFFFIWLFYLSFLDLKKIN